MNKELKWIFVPFVILFICMGVTMVFEAKYDRDIVVACYESGKLDCDSLNK